ncbi:hypothetical protein ACETK8_03715 [Brevundimonas staleyi]|uniref:Uncharacterized protein n=1 Tax=Brevundimonas staleyi TaxID=74326 RepID=A0ABW0FUE4_9CAUL
MTNNVHRLATEQRGRRALGVRTARQLREAEHNLDRALADKLALGQMLLSGRIEARMGVAVGQSVIADIARAFSLAVEAREALGAAHNGLAEVAADQGIVWNFDGPGETKPGERPLLSEPVPS